MSNTFIIWQDPETRMWEPVAKLIFTNDRYKLIYTIGSLNERFAAFPRMNIKEKEYTSNELFPFFKNRLISDRRPEFQSMLSWMDMDLCDYDPLELLSVSGGAKKTDNFRIIKVPEKTENNEYRIKFFVSGIAYLPTPIKAEILTFNESTKLHYELDSLNMNDSNAITILRSSDNQRVGYYPKYLNEDLRRLSELKQYMPEPESYPQIKVIKVNPTAPEQYRLLCELVSYWPKCFEPFQSKKYQLLKEQNSSSFTNNQDC